MGKRFRDFFERNARLPGACVMLTVPAKRMMLPRDPQAGEDLIVFHNELVRANTQNLTYEQRARLLLTVPGPAPGPTDRCEEIDGVAVKRIKLMDARTDDKENGHSHNKRTAASLVSESPVLKLQEKADVQDELTSSGFLVTVLPDVE